jgi:tetratricopeptide (TPR) repeat protein
MGLTVADSYYLKAKSAASEFCGDWEEVCEALNYALSYDENHSASLCLLGEIYAKNLAMPERAFECFDKIITNDTAYHEVYHTYARYLIWYDEIDRAQKLVAFALTIKAVSKGPLLWTLAYIEETKENYKKGLSLLKKAKRYCYNDGYFSFIEDEEKRFKKKVKLEKKSTKSSKKGKKTKKKKKK